MKKQKPFEVIINESATMIYALVLGLGSIMDTPEFKMIDDGLIAKLRNYQFIILFSLLHENATNVNPEFSEDEFIEASSKAIKSAFMVVDRIPERPSNWFTQDVIDDYFEYMALVQNQQETENMYEVFCKHFTEKIVSGDFEDASPIESAAQSIRGKQYDLVYYLAMQRVDVVRKIVKIIFQKYEPIF